MWKATHTVISEHVTYCWWEKPCTSWYTRFYMFYTSQVVQDFFHQQYQKDLAQTKRQFHFIRWIVVVAMQIAAIPYSTSPLDSHSVNQFNGRLRLISFAVALPNRQWWLSFHLSNLNHQPAFGVCCFFPAESLLGKLVRSSNELFSFPYLKHKHWHYLHIGWTTSLKQKLCTPLLAQEGWKPNILFRKNKQNTWTMACQEFTLPGSNNSRPRNDSFNHLLNFLS